MRTGFQLDELRTRLRRADLDAAVITSVANIRYTTGIVIQSHQVLPLRLMMLIVPVEGEPVFLGCETRETLTSQAADWLCDIRCYREFDVSPIRLLSDTLMDMNLQESRLGIETDALVASFWEQLRELCPRAKWRNVGPVMDRMRMVKSTLEIEQLRDAYTGTVASIAEAFTATRVGDSEREIARRIHRGLVEHGADQVAFNIVVIEDRTPWAHPPPGDSRLAAGQIVRVDVGATFGLYCSDVGRTAAVGHWRPDVRQVFDSLRLVRETIVPSLRPGMRVGDIQPKIMQLFPRFGLPEPSLHTMLMGHGLGIEIHEPPIIKPSTDTELTPGMVLNIEPDVRPDGLCLAHENTFLVTDENVELLAPLANDSPLLIDG